MKTMHIRVDLASGEILRRKVEVASDWEWRKEHRDRAMVIRRYYPHQRLMVSTCMDRDRRGKVKIILSIFPGMYA